MQLEPDDALTLDTIGACTAARAITTGGRGIPRSCRAGTNDAPISSSTSVLRCGSSATSPAPRRPSRQRHARRRTSIRHDSALSHLRRQTSENNHTDRLETLIKNTNGDLQSEIGLRSALAKEYDDLGEYDLAFVHMAKAYAKLRPKLDYSTAHDDALFEKNNQHRQRRIPERATPVIPRTNRFSSWVCRAPEPRWSSESCRAIPGLSAGELQNFGIALKRATRTKSNRILDPETIAASTNLDFAELGNTYLESTRPVTGHTAHFIDKTPLNFLHIGFIHLALPNAKIICLRRNPMDSCLSNYRQLFALDDSPYYNYSYDLLETGHYYILFDRLMQHWQHLLPGRIMELQYESVVDDQEAQSRAIIDFCGLDWEDTCLASNETLHRLPPPAQRKCANRSTRMPSHVGVTTKST